MKLIYISIPMNYNTVPDLQLAFQQCFEDAKRLVDDEIEVINSIPNLAKYADDFLYEKPEHKELFSLAKSLELLSFANYAYFADGWQAVRCCRIEHECAEQYGVDIIKD